MNEAILELVGVSKTFKSPSGAVELEVLRNISLTLHRGEIVSISGRSGSGKSTLLHIAALVEEADSGKVIINGQDTAGLSEAGRAALRRDHMGFIFQNSMLLEDFSALENTAFPLMLSGMGRKEAYDEASALLDRLGLGGRLDHRPFELSGGERQRVALARAVINKPSIVFADEPTGALDEESAAQVEDMLFEAVSSLGISLLLVTHNTAFAARSSRSLTLTHKELVDNA